MKKKAILILEDGNTFVGEGFGAMEEMVGEVVFNTGMTGYQEVLTDPSYFGQIVTMTYPLIGNYGINLEDLESSHPKVRGFIVKELCPNPSNFRSVGTLDEYLKKNHIAGIQGIDTRELTKILRDKGTLRGIISFEEDTKFESVWDKLNDYRIYNAVENVTTKTIETYKGSGFRVALLDLGIKQNIVRSLLSRGCEVVQFPADSTIETILACNPDGIMLSNGPGDPKDCTGVISTIQSLYGKKPIFGICLGHQLTALANGADTQRLKYGHRGCNHPVKDLEKDITYITSQNHGYTIVEESLDPSKTKVTHRNMNDNTVEGIRYLDAPVFTVQFHPEASPGPKDTAYLFDEFIELMKNNQNLKKDN